MGVAQYEFDPSYGYTIETLLDVKAPKEPKDFDAFWTARYENALTIDAKPQTTVVSEIRMAGVFLRLLIPQQINLLFVAGCCCL